MENANKVKIVTFNPLALYTDTEDNNYASLTWSIRKGYPRVSVYTDNNRDKSNTFSFDKMITAPLDSVTVGVFIQKFQKIIASKDEVKLALKCYNVKYVNNERTNDVVLQATLIVGRDKEGIIYLAAIADDKKKVKFKLLPNAKWHTLVNAQGDEITDKAELSTIYATAYCKRLNSLMDKHLADEAVVRYTENKNSGRTGSSDPFNSTGY